MEKSGKDEWNLRGKSGKSNFISHWVRIKLEGFKPERLISEAMAQGIAIRSIQYRDETEVYLTVAKADLSLMKKRARSKYKLTVVREGGAGYGVRRILSNKMMLAGMGIFVMVVIYQSLFIKEVKIVGCKSIPEQDIIACVREEGLYEGALKKFDCTAIERRLFKEFDKVVWARVAYEGNYVEVQIAESDKEAAEELDRNTPCHIVAEEDCYIERILSYRGKSVVSKDDFVPKGGIMITGIIPIDHATYQPEKDDATEYYVHAEGKIVARVPYNYSFDMDSDNGKEEAEAMLRRWIKENIPENAQILNKSLNFYKKKNIIRVYGTVETRRQVGVKEEIVIDQQQRGDEKDTD